MKSKRRDRSANARGASHKHNPAGTKLQCLFRNKAATLRGRMPGGYLL